MSQREPLVEDKSLPMAERDWLREAIGLIAADTNRSADTHLVRVPLPSLGGVTLYLKDESTHPSGSLKHRLARSLFLYGLCNGRIRQGRPIVEASSGSTAISEAYFAQLLGLPFIAVVPESTAEEKIAQITFHGGEIRKVAPHEIYAEAEALATREGGHYMDQFTNAERATDWRGNNNIAESLFAQMAREPHPVPRWVVVSAGTGGTSATIGRYIRYQGAGYLDSKLCVVDPENSVFFDHFHSGDPNAHQCARLAHRRHRPAPGRALLPTRRNRPHDAGARRRQHRHHPLARGGARAASAVAPPAPTSMAPSPSPPNWQRPARAAAWSR